MTDHTSLRSSILRALQAEPRNDVELARAVSGHSPRNINASVAALQNDGLVALKWGKWRLTKLGRQSLPSLHTLPPMQPYVRPPVLRRPGSDHSHIPSRYGDLRVRRDA